IPFRFIVDLQLSLSFPELIFSLTLPIYSDPFISGEFNERSEDIPWDAILLGGMSGAQSLSFPSTSMNWGLSASLTPTMLSFLRPLLNSFSIRDLKTQFSWNTATAGDLPVENSSAINSPERQYFVPQQLRLPSGTVALSGTILQFPAKNTSSATASEDENEIPEYFEQFYAPETRRDDDRASSIEDDDSGAAQNNEFIRPAALNTPAFTKDDDLGYKLSYSLSNKHFLVMFFENFTEDTYSISHSNFQDDINISLSQNLKLVQSLFNMQTGLTYRGVFRESFGFSDMLTDPIRDDLIRQSEMQNSQRLNLSNTTTVNPLALVYTDLGFSLTHSLGLKLWNRSDTGDGNFVDDTFMWDADHVNQHQLQSSFSFSLFEEIIGQKMSFRYVLPPLNEVLDISYALTSNPFRTSLKLTMRQETTEDSLSAHDLLWNNKLSLMDDLNLGADFRWAFDPDIVPEEYKFSLKAFWYDASLAFKNRNFLTLNSTQTAWLQQGSQEFRLSNMQHNLKIPFKLPENNSVRFSGSVNTGWKHDFVEFTSSSLSFKTSLDILFPNFLALRLSVNSVNNAIYQYFPDYTRQIGIPTRNLFEDLLSSFNFFDISERRKSNFKLQSISLQLFHDLGDWMLKMEYDWLPKIVTTDGIRQYEIENKFNFFLQWLPISEIKNEIDIDIIEDKWVVDY
ncbi:MAG: hypothetical protein ACR2PY_08575, partial [Salinispira sp.]